jgi:hypothetical protein
VRSSAADWFVGSNAKLGMGIGVRQDPSSNSDCRILSSYIRELKPEIAGESTVEFVRERSLIIQLLRIWGGPLAAFVGAGEAAYLTSLSRQPRSAIGRCCEASVAFIYCC